MHIHTHLKTWAYRILSIIIIHHLSGGFHKCGYPKNHPFKIIYINGIFPYQLINHPAIGVPPFIWTPADQGAEHGLTELAQELLAAKADPNRKSKPMQRWAEMESCRFFTGNPWGNHWKLKININEKSMEIKGGSLKFNWGVKWGHVLEGCIYVATQFSLLIPELRFG